MVNTDPILCQLCGEPMPKGEEMFQYHGHSRPCPKPPLKRETVTPAQKVAIELLGALEVEIAGSPSAVVVNRLNALQLITGAFEAAIEAATDRVKAQRKDA